MEITQELKDLVMEEALNIKKHATKEELSKLDPQRLAPMSTVKCVYGLMTGNCFSQRADELIKNCAKRVYVPTKDVEIFDHMVLNGAPKGNRGGGFFTAAKYYSPIEVFIANSDPQQNKSLIDFIKDGTQPIKL